MTVLRLCVALCAGVIVIGSPETDYTDTTTEESTEESTSVTTETEYNDTISFTNDGWRLIASDSSFVINIPYRLVDLYYTCQLNNSVTGEIITCKGTPSHYMFDCDFICSRYALNLAKRNKLDTGIWNLIGIGYSRLQTAFEVARVGSVHKHRSVKFKPEKLKSEYSTCKLQNEAGTTIYCKSVDGYAELDKAIDCNDVCTTFVNCVADVEKIKGNWTLIGEINNSSSQTGFEILVGSLETDYTDTTTVDVTEVSTSATTETEYKDAVSFIKDVWQYITLDRSFTISIPYRLVGEYYTCHLNNSVTGEIITCKGPQSYYLIDCNHLCSHYALNLAKKNKLDTGIWNLIGKSRYGEFHTAFEIARVGSVQKRRSVKYKPEKLKSEYTICKLQNQAGTTIYCKSVQRYHESDKVDCNDVCAAFVDCVADVDKIKGNWTLIGESNNGSSQTGFEILVGTPQTEYTETIHLSDDGWRLIASDSNFVITIPYKLVELYFTCKLQNSVTGETITCKGPRSYQSFDCNFICSHYALNLAKENKLDTGIWNLIGESIDGKFHTAFEIARVGGERKHRSVKYDPEKLIPRHSICKLQNQAGTTIYCKSVDRNAEPDVVDCNDVCSIFVNCVTDVEKIKGNWTLISEHNYGSSRTGFEILVGTPETGYTDTTTEEATEESTSVTTETEYTDSIHLSDDGWRLIASDSSFVITIPYRLVELCSVCQLHNSATGEIITCKGSQSYYHFDCNFICSRYALNLAKRKKVNTGIWNLIGTSKHGKFHTAFEIARVGGVHQNRSVKYDPAKLKPENNICKLQNQAGTTIYCKSVNLYRENDKEDCYDVCTTVVNRVTDVEKIKGNWTLIGESYYGSSSRTGFEILVEGGTEVSNLATTETEYKDTVNLIGPISRSSDIQAHRVVVEMPGSLAVDQDIHFALSLVPMLRQRTLKDKLDVEIDILNYFKSKLANRTP